MSEALARTAPEPTILVGHEHQIHDVAFSPDGQILASASTDGTIRLWDTTKPSAKATILTGSKYQVLSVAFSPNGQVLASTDTANIRLWNLSPPSTNYSLLKGHTNSIRVLTFSPNGQILASAGLSTDKTIRLWDMNCPGTEPEVLNVRFSPLDMAFSPDGQILASAHPDGTIQLWDIGD